MKHSLLLLLCAAGIEAASPSIVRLFPLGGQRGTSVAVEFRGDLLSNAKAVEFDCEDLRWQLTTSASRQFLRGTVAIAPGAALGPHLVRIISLDGHSNTVLFNVGQFPAVREAEPNEDLHVAQRIPQPPVEIYGSMDILEDGDVYRLEARAGEQLSFDLRSTDIGSALECKLVLFDSQGKVIARNDDRDDFDDTPYFQHTFVTAGTYYVKIDQYRGPRGADGKNNTYILRIANLPRITYGSALGAKTNSTVRLTIAGTDLQKLDGAYLSEVRLAEYYRMTYPYVMPLAVRPDPSHADGISRIPGQVLKRSPDSAELEFAIPGGVRPGLWRLWATASGAAVEGYSFEVADPAQQSQESTLRQAGQKDRFRFEAVAGEPLHFSILAAQLGQPNIDTLLQLRDGEGKLLAQNDDVVSGVATLGNPDSSLFYTPDRDGPVFLTVRDRLNRGGPSLSYRLKRETAKPSFQLFAPPDAVNVVRGGAFELKVFMAREEGFAGEVPVWIEGLPTGAEAAPAKFRADQAWEPGSDNLQMIVPEVTLSIRVPDSVPAGSYPIRVIGEAGGRQVLAHANAMIGPLTNLFNFTRRPLPVLTLTVSEPFAPELSFKEDGPLVLRPGKEIQVSVVGKAVPPSADVVLKDLPPGVTFRVVGRAGDTFEMALQASLDAKPGSGSITAEALIGNRWATSKLLKLIVESRASRNSDSSLPSSRER